MTEKWIDVAISAGSAALISGASAILAVIATGGQNAVTGNTFLVAGIFGALSLGKDLRSSLKMPPVPDNGPMPVALVPTTPTTTTTTATVSVPTTPKAP